MHSATKPAELDTPLLENAPDPYCGTPLGVEAAWCPNGMDVLPAAAGTQWSTPPMEP